LYADQNHVYKELGAPLLENALEGFNCAIVAYGQTGSGKSYSIFGNDANQGIIPMVSFITSSKIFQIKLRSSTTCISILMKKDQRAKLISLFE
jgi:kinesin family protein 1